MNPQGLMQMMGAWNVFNSNHPKFISFIEAVKRKGIEEDTIIAITVTDKNGETIETNIKVKQSDIELFNTLKNVQ